MEMTPDPDPNTDSNPKFISKVLSTTTPTGSAATCLLCFAGSSAVGAVFGSIFGYGKGLITKKGFKASFVDARSSAKTGAVSLGVESLVLCFLERLRGKHDVINAGVAGCCTGLALSFSGTPEALVQSCLAYGAFSFIFEGFYMLPPLSLPLPNELRDSFSFCCHSIKTSGKPKNAS